LCGEVASELGFAVVAVAADWARFGRSAGCRRNQAMLGLGVGLVVAFPGGPGTADMVRRARGAGVRVCLVGGAL